MASNWIKILNSATRGYKITKIDQCDIGPDNFILHVTFDGIIKASDSIMVARGDFGL